MWRAFTATLPDDVDIDAARQLNQAYDLGLISQSEFIEKVKDVTGKEPHVLEKYDGDIVKNSALLDYIGELRGRGYKIGLLSNIATPWIRDTFLSPDEQKLFDDMVFSFEAGVTKPDPRIFHLSCSHLGVEPEEAVMVDDIDRYCEAAEAIGMKSVVYRDFKQAKAYIEKILAQK